MINSIVMAAKHGRNLVNKEKVMKYSIHLLKLTLILSNGLMSNWTKLFKEKD